MAIETASRTSSVAVVDENKFTEINQDARLTHSETLLPQLEEVMKLAGATCESIDLIAVSIGPGSFTGLRIGLATAKALSYAWNVAIIGVPTLLSMAYHFRFTDALILPMFDAQKSRAYVQQLRWIGDKLKELTPIEVRPIDEIIMTIGQIDEVVIICGDAIDKFKIDRSKLPSNVEIAPINLRMPRAVNVGLCARDILKVNEPDNVMNLEPLYIRRSEAEVLWEKRSRS